MNNYKELLKKVSNQMINIKKGEAFSEDCPISIIDMDKWEWAQGVGLYGMYKYYECTNDEEILNFLIKWFDDRLEEGLPVKNVNTMAPMLTLAFLYEQTKNEKYLPIMKEWADWVINEMPRTEDNGLQHIVTNVGGENKGQLWDDTLFMTVLFLAKLGKLVNEKSYIEESIHQFLVHIKYLFDKKTGLWYHGWTFIERHNFAEALWGRGNCWYTAGVVDYLDMVDLDAGIKTFLLDTFKSQVDALRKYQDESGLWHTLINEDTSYLEVSATAGFAYGILKGVRLGYLGEEYKEMGIKALNAVIDNIGEDGTVLQVSYGTGLSYDLNYYREIPICPMTYGQALAILALTEGK